MFSSGLGDRPQSQCVLRAIFLLLYPPANIKTRKKTSRLIQLILVLCTFPQTSKWQARYQCKKNPSAENRGIHHQKESIKIMAQSATTCLFNLNHTSRLGLHLITFVKFNFQQSIFVTGINLTLVHFVFRN